MIKILFFPVWSLLLYGVYDYKDCFPTAKLIMHFMKTASMKIPRYILKKCYFKKYIENLGRTFELSKLKLLFFNALIFTFFMCYDIRTP